MSPRHDTTPQVHFPRRAGRQRGAILVTSLLLLLTLTIIGVSVMQITRMQERAAGNTRDLNLAFQGAEAAVRDAENLIWSTPVIVTCNNAATCIRPRGTLPEDLASQTAAWWDANAQEYGTDGTQDLDELDEDPQFVVEEIAWVGPLVVDEPGARMFYQITARSTGGTGLATSLVQTTYAKPE
jgi:type IV pilus assembly protein PilX